MPPPIWFLDIDGVLNSWDSPDPRCGRYTVAWVPVLGQSVRVEYSPTIVDRINDLHRSGRVEVVWLTSWNDHARTQLAPEIGLMDFHVVPEPHERTTRWSALPGTDATWWKVGRILEHIVAHPDRPYIWTDDCLTKADERTLRDAGGPPSLLVTVPRTPGLTHTDLDRIEQFCSVVRGITENRSVE